jgi:hypothetical protein
MTELAIVRENVTPQSLEDWKTYIAAASATEAKAGHALVEAIIEKGRRIAEFYAAYKARGQRWGDRWSDVCKNTIGISDDMCRRYMIVAENVPRAFGTFLPTEIWQVLRRAAALGTGPRLFQPHARPAAILGDEFHAGGLKGRADGSYRVS